jgi:hypothetical protein
VKAGPKNTVASWYRFLLLYVGFRISRKKTGTGRKRLQLRGNMIENGKGTDPTIFTVTVFNRDNTVLDPVFFSSGKSGLSPTTNLA